MTTTEPSILFPDLTPARVGQRSVADRTSRGSTLRRVLVGLDAAAIAAGWTIGLLTTNGLTTSFGQIGPVRFASFTVMMTAVTIAVMATHQLYLSRACTIRAVEIGRLFRSSGVAGAAALLLHYVLPVEVSLTAAGASSAASFLLLMMSRGVYRYWLQMGRRDGRFLRPVVIVGANEEAYELYKLTKDHPEMGFSVTAVIGDGTTEETFEVPVIGPIEDTPSLMQAMGANGALVAVSAVPPRLLNGIVRSLLKRDAHVHLSSGLRGVDHRRLRAQTFAHEPLFYLEPIRLQPWQLALKRTIDVVLSLVGGLFVALPLVAVAAVLIKLQDRGPVFYRHTRIGRNGEPFTMIKLRTMIPNAAKLYDELAQTHAGREGPLVKLADDPRRTRVGKFLERLSIDELPQLWNVLNGTMSLVGPRPSLPAEVPGLDEALRARFGVRPGISGLWQVEARDNPSFAAYKRYDLFYLENWSVSLDIAILIATVQRVLLRGLELTISRRPELGGKSVPVPASRT